MSPFKDIVTLSSAEEQKTLLENKNETFGEISTRPRQANMVGVQNSFLRMENKGRVPQIPCGEMHEQ